MKENLSKLKKSALIDRVDDAFNYFNGFRLEELKEDDQYYINALMFYIEKLESNSKNKNEVDKNIIKNIIVFLEENEQYGDNWKNEIKVLNKILTKTK
jgi:hypothetical protein|tara:strand:+ start:265 stop:558 length:294 start_codon:yes stop_codon:yes gene_type:complete